MTTRARSNDIRPNDPGPTPVTPDAALDDHVRQVRRRLHGVSREQLADERRTYEKRTATIEARTRRS
jgi:hypothetical protein